MNRPLFSLAALLVVCSPALAAAGMGEDFAADAPTVAKTDAIRDLAKTLAESRANYPRRLYDLCVANAKDKDVAERELEEIASDVVARRVDPSMADSDGRTALHMLAQRYQPATGTVNPRATGRSQVLCDQIALALLSLGADPNRRDRFGWTPVQLAAVHPAKPWNESWQASRLYSAMVASGGDENAPAPNGRSAKQLLADETQRLNHPRTLTDRELCEMDQMSCR